MTAHRKSAKVSPDEPNPPRVYKDAFEATVAEREALAEDELLGLNLDPAAAVTAAIAALPAIRALRDEAKRHFKAFDLAVFDTIESLTYAFQYAHISCLASARPEEPIADLGAEGAKMRELLLTDARALAARGLLDAKRLEDVKGIIGYRNIAIDLQVLAKMFRDRWAQVAGKTALTEEELGSAEALGDRLLTTVGERTQPATPTEALDDRARAFTLFMRAYDQIRRAATFLRWSERDADTLVPSLYAGRSKGHRTPDAGPDPVVDPVAPAPVVASPVGPGAFPPVNGTPAPPPVASGHPGGNPFAPS